jgi:hypothetical protein
MCRFAINRSIFLSLAVFASSLLLADSVIANLEEGLMVYFSFDQGETDMVRDLTTLRCLITIPWMWVKGTYHLCSG